VKIAYFESRKIVERLNVFGVLLQIDVRDVH